MAQALSLIALLCLGFIAWLTADGLRAIIRRRRTEQARKPRRLRVVRREEVAGELLCLQLVAARGKALPAFSPGQHLLLSAPAGKNGKRIQRAYSLAAWNRHPDCYELGIKLEPQGAMSQWLWQHLPAGAEIESSLPQGHFVVEPGSGTLVLIGGGIGITPMRAMLHEALSQQRPVILFHLARNAATLLYHREFAALATTHLTFRYWPQLSRPDASWPGACGRINAAQICTQLAQPETADFYLCAGNEMMASLRQELQSRGIADDRIHSEAFGANFGAGQSGLSLAIKHGKTTQTIITAGEPSLLATLEANDLEVPAECRAGSCGQCLAILEAGKIDWLAQPEFSVGPQQFLPCICAARSNLSIALPS
jgi:ferredoxin-NADP reductase